VQGQSDEEGKPLNQKVRKIEEQQPSFQYYQADSSIFNHNYQKFPNFTKVLVPAVYREYLEHGIPDWITNRTIQERLGYSVFLYQKTDSSQPLFIRNRGTEGGVFLRYIVDHYDNFPDVAIFVHANPTDHAPHWLEKIGCISPNATYMNINFSHLKRTSKYW
jgi:hypothetical protein